MYWQSFKLQRDHHGSSQAGVIEDAQPGASRDRRAQPLRGVCRRIVIDESIHCAAEDEEYDDDQCRREADAIGQRCPRSHEAGGGLGQAQG